MPKHENPSIRGASRVQITGATYARISPNLGYGHMPWKELRAGCLLNHIFSEKGIFVIGYTHQPIISPAPRKISSRGSRFCIYNQADFLSSSLRIPKPFDTRQAC
jgi:hypothetical protein